MNAKIFRSNFLTSILVLLVSFVLIFGILFEYFESRIMSELRNEANYISYAVELEGAEFIEKFKDSDKRITLISPDGVVLADTSTEGEKTDNHLSREEIKKALSEGWGFASRYSETLTEKVIYYAVKLENGRFLRVSTVQNSVLTILLGLMQPLIVIVLIIMGISFYLSYHVSKSIVKPINEINPDNPINSEVYEELEPLLAKLKTQKRIIDRQIKEARQKQEEFRLISENMNEGLLVVDSVGDVLTKNQAVLKLLDIGNTEKKNISYMEISEEFKDIIKNVLSGQHTQKDIENSGRVCRVIGNPVRDGKTVIGAVVMIIDITEAANREQLRREFTSNVSHELNTPLTSISGFAEMMKDGGMPNDTVMDFSRSIYDEAQRLITLVTDIIRISELDDGDVCYEKETIDLYRLSQRILERLEIVAKKRNIDLRLIGESAEIFGTEKILDEMIFNLCDNAVKYNKDNGLVEVIVSKSACKKVYLTVRDTGIGIPNAERSRVFERFYRVDKSHSKEVGGTGLGLSIVKHAASYHNAEIILESAVDEGTRITVEFNE